MHSERQRWETGRLVHVHPPPEASLPQKLGRGTKTRYLQSILQHRGRVALSQEAATRMSEERRECGLLVLSAQRSSGRQSAGVGGAVPRQAKW